MCVIKIINTFNLTAIAAYKNINMLIDVKLVIFFCKNVIRESCLRKSKLMN